MSILEQLYGCLPEVVALVLISRSHRLVLNRRDIEIPWLIHLISDLAESIQRVDCVLVSLLKTKNIVDPRVKIARRVLTFESFPHDLYEFYWIALRPFRQNYVVYFSSILFHPKITQIRVFHHFRQTVKFRSQLTYITKVIQ